jgi:hypothetical protein
MRPTLRASPVLGTYLECLLGRKRFTFQTTTSMHFFALEAAKRMLTFIVTRDRLSATKTEVRLALIARETIFAIKTEGLLAHFAIEGIFALTTACRLTLFTMERIFAVKTKGRLTLVTPEIIFALKTEGLLTLFTLVSTGKVD